MFTVDLDINLNVNFESALITFGNSNTTYLFDITYYYNACNLGHFCGSCEYLKVDI